LNPLQDVRIIAVEQYGAGPFGSVILADLGADVIKVEDPATGGDIGRYVVPHQEGEDSLFFQTFNRNKRSIALDLTSDEGRGVFTDLVRVSDVVYSNLRGDVPARLRIRYDDLKEFNPAIVCVSLSAYGTDSSRRSRPGYDYLFQGELGWMSVTGEREGPPTKTGLSLVDFSGGYVAAITVLAALHAARRDGVGSDCDLSLYDVAANLLTYPATWYLNSGDEPKRVDRSAHPSLVPFQNFPTATGWIVVTCPKEKFWTRLVDAIGLPELSGDERFADFGGRGRHRAELIELLDRQFLTRPAEEWLPVLEGAGVPCAPIRTIPEALEDPFMAERGMVVEADHPDWGVVRQMRSPVRISTGAPKYRRAPRLNEDATEILALLGHDTRGPNGSSGLP
jgi:crotonobetainyl-CoA:carnitine CoA-transferase CaiB-like acyl-CoA transferase